MTKDNNGKIKVEKGGLGEVTREGFEYELTANLELDTRHNATASKDRTNLFMGKPAFTPSEETGKLIAAWCEEGEEIDLGAELDKCGTPGEVTALYNRHKGTVDADEGVQALFKAKQLFLKSQQPSQA